MHESGDLPSLREGALRPYEFQLHDQEVLAKHNWTAPVTIETGGGKSVTAVLSGLNSGASTKLIVAPQGTHADYADTINALASPNDNADIFTLRNDTVRGRKAWDDLRWGVPGWYFVTPQLFARSDWRGIAPDLAVVDESHLLLGWDTASRKRLIGRGRLDPKTGLRAGALVAGMRLAMSGTPVRNKFENWYALARFIYPERYGPGDIADASRMAWLDRWMVSEYDHFAHNHKKYTVEKNPGEFVASLPVVIQHFRRATCCEFHPGGFLAHLPEPQVIERPVILLPEQKKAIRDLEEEYITFLDENPMVVNLPVTLRQRIRQLTLGVPTVSPEGDVDFADDAKSPVLDDAIEVLNSIGDEPMVLFTSSRKFARVAALRLRAEGFAAEEYSGAVPDKVRAQLRADFKSGAIRVLVVVVQAGGTGLNLQAARVEYWADTVVDQTDETQAFARTDRMGQDRQVQRFIAHDDLGVNRGLFGRNLEKRLELNRSNRRKVGT